MDLSILRLLALVKQGEVAARDQKDLNSGSRAQSPKTPLSIFSRKSFSSSVPTSGTPNLTAIYKAFSKVAVAKNCSSLVTVTLQGSLPSSIVFFKIKSLKIVLTSFSGEISSMARQAPVSFSNTAQILG
jgi:hypothetical protein